MNPRSNGYRIIEDDSITQKQLKSLTAQSTLAYEIDKIRPVEFLRTQKVNLTQ